jgi:hypothetical protein
MGHTGGSVRVTGHSIKAKAKGTLGRLFKTFKHEKEVQRTPHRRKSIRSLFISSTTASESSFVASRRPISPEDTRKHVFVHPDYASHAVEEGHMSTDGANLKNTLLPECNPAGASSTTVNTSKDVEGLAELVRYKKSTGTATRHTSGLHNTFTTSGLDGSTEGAPQPLVAEGKPAESTKAAGPRASLRAKEFHKQFDELRELVRCNLKEDKLGADKGMLRPFI